MWRALVDRDAIVFKMTETSNLNGLGSSYSSSETIEPMVVVTRGGATVTLGCDPTTADEVLIHLKDPTIAQPIPLAGKRASDYYKIVIDGRTS